MIRPGARSSSVEKVEANRAGFLVQQSTTPEPILIVSVVAANADMGISASRTSRESACQIGVEALLLGVLHVHSMALGDGVPASWKYRATGCLVGIWISGLV